MMPLTMAGLGETNSIKRILGRDEVRRHLENLGFIAGEPVTVVSEFAGNMILQIKDARVALSKNMVNRIFI